MIKIIQEEINDWMEKRTQRMLSKRKHWINLMLLYIKYYDNLPRE